MACCCPAAPAGKKAAAEPDPRHRHRLQSMFKKAPKAVASSTATDASSDDLLKDILGGLGDGGDAGPR